MTSRKAAALAKAIVADLEALKITEGRFTGQHLKVMPWQRSFAAGVATFSTVALSMARGNAKTTTVAGLACSALTPGGALHRFRGEVVIVASSLNQARIPFRHVIFFMAPIMARENRRSPRPWRVVDNSHQAFIEHRPTGTVLKAIGSDAKRAHGLAPSLVICDEPAKWEGGGRDMYIALDTALGKQVDAKLLALGTRPNTADHWFQKLLNDQSGVIWVQNHCAERHDEDFDIEVIRRANPSYDYMPDLVEAIGLHADRARDGGSELSSWRALRLNKGTPEVEDAEVLVALENWDAITSHDASPRAGPVAIGVDLGGGTSMSAIAFYWPETGRPEAYGAFPAMPSLAERGKQDYVGERYAVMQERGELFVYPGKATNNVRFLEDMFAGVEGYAKLGIAADRYKQKDLEQALVGVGSDTEVEWRGVGRGPEGGEDVRAFQREVLDAHMSVEPHVALESAIAESVIHRDTNGNAALNKARNKGRIDVVQASLLAVGMGRRWRLPSEFSRPFNVNDYVLTEMYENDVAVP